MSTSWHVQCYKWSQLLHSHYLQSMGWEPEQPIWADWLFPHNKIHLKPYGIWNVNLHLQHFSQILLYCLSVFCMAARAVTIISFWKVALTSLIWVLTILTLRTVQVLKQRIQFYSKHMYRDNKIWKCKLLFWNFPNSKVYCFFLKCFKGVRKHLVIFQNGIIHPTWI